MFKLSLFSGFYIYFLYFMSFLLLSFSLGFFWFKNRKTNKLNWQLLFLWALCYSGHEFIEFYNEFLSFGHEFVEKVGVILHILSLFFFLSFSFQIFTNKKTRKKLRNVVGFLLLLLIILELFFQTVDYNIFIKISFLFGSFLISLLLNYEANKNKESKQYKISFLHLSAIFFVYGVTSLGEIGLLMNEFSHYKTLLIVVRVFVALFASLSIFITSLHTISFKGFEIVNNKIKISVIIFAVMIGGMVIWGNVYVGHREKEHNSQMSQMYLNELSYSKEIINENINKFTLSAQSLSLAISAEFEHEEIYNSQKEWQISTSVEENINKLLDGDRKIYNYNIIYFLNNKGQVIYSTNRLEKKSFVGKNYSFRNYFKEAISGKSGLEISKGVTSGIKGLYVSSPVVVDSKIIGVLVIKNNLSNISGIFKSKVYNEFLISPDKSIFYSNNLDFVDKKILSEEKEEKTMGFKKVNDYLIYREADGKKQYFIFRYSPISVSGWGVGVMSDHEHIESVYRDIVLRISSITFLSFLIFFISFNILYNSLELKISQLMYKDIFDNTSDMIHSVDASGNFMYVNQAWKQKLGFSDEEISGMSYYDIIHKSELAHCKNLFKEALEGSKLKDIETKFVAKNKKIIDVYGSTSCSFRGGKPYAARGIFRDVTEEKKSHNELKNKNIELEKFSKMVTGRELKMIELKKKIKGYIKKYGKI